jgi:hypothetical protein
MSTTSLLAGVAGEYFVAAELSRRGFIASITLRNTRGIDIVVTNKEATKNRYHSVQNLAQEKAAVDLGRKERGVLCRESLLCDGRFG